MSSVDEVDEVASERIGKPRRWVPAVAAAGVVALAAATLSVLPDSLLERSAPLEAASAPQNAPGAQGAPAVGADAVAGGKQTAANDALLVRNGSRVRVSGEVIAVPGSKPVFCPSRPVPTIASPVPSCPANLSVQLAGVDLTKLTDLQTIQGVQTGRATLVGIWTDHTISVQQQTAPVPDDGMVTPPLPCRPPAGGWPIKPGNIQDPKVNEFLEQRRDQAFGPAIYHPYGEGRDKPMVVFVGVARGDRVAFRKAMEKVYPGNLCVAPAKLSQQDADDLSGRVAGMMNRADLGITSSYTQPDGASENVELLVYTDFVKAALTPVGLDKLKIEPAVLPVS